jgi:hypothetical protein
MLRALSQSRDALASRAGHGYVTRIDTLAGLDLGLRCLPLPSRARPH